jgi:polyhydroxyalkanoate synthesis regulator phasin
VKITALIASIVSICLAFFAIWQANHHRDQSDKLNRDTTEKLARIEAFATSTKEDAFAEIRRWGDFARRGGTAWEEADRIKEEEIRKLRDELQAATSAEINRALQAVESKLSPSTGTSDISDLKREFESLKQEIAKIQDKAVTETKQAERRSRIQFVLGNASTDELTILKAVCRNPNWTTHEELHDMGYKYDQIMTGLDLAKSLGLLRSESYEYLLRGDPAWDVPRWVTSHKYQLDLDLCEALQR